MTQDDSTNSQEGEAKYAPGAIGRKGTFLWQMDSPSGSGMNLWSGHLQSNNGYPQEYALRAAILFEAAPELLDALAAYRSAFEMPTYGDASDFVWPAITERVPGEHHWGYVCEKHGLGYQYGCVCCQDDFERHQDQKDREARYARDNALRQADRLAEAAMAKADGSQS